jgi:Uma2 family endonuclease
MSISLRYTTADLELLPEVEGTRYEIIDGELYVSKSPDWRHQYACVEIGRVLQEWNHRTGAGLAIFAPGLIFASDDNVVPDVVWVSRARLAAVVDAQGHLRAAPELVVEVLSPGELNERRDRDLKLRLYSRQGVHEYWIVDWRARTVRVYRRGQAALRLVATLDGEDELTSPLLPAFSCPISTFWAPAL